MKIAVLSSPEDVSLLVPILDAFREIGVSAYGLKIRPNWEGLTQSAIGRHVERASHFLVICSERSIGTSWFHFTAGYGLGRNTGFALFRTDAAWEPPSYLRAFPILDDLEELSAYYRVERAEWLVRESKRSARAALLEMGISYHSDSFVRSVVEGTIKAVELFLKSGFHADARDAHGVPLLCLAARGRHRGIVELLLEFGATIDQQSEDRGYSALMDASLQGSLEILDLLLSRGATPNLTSKDGQTALVIAVGRGDLEMARHLVNYGSDPDIADKLGLSARAYAALFKNRELTRLFEGAVPQKRHD